MPTEFLIDIYNLILPAFNTIMTLSVPFGIYLYKYKIPKYELRKGKLVKNPKKIKLPPKIKEKANAITTDELYNVVENEAVIIFHDRLMEMLNEQQRIIMNNNLKNLEIKETLKSRIQKLLLNNGINPYVKKSNIKSGSYSSSSNLVIIRDSRCKSTIYHELMHMASTVKVNDTYYIGFKQRMKTESIGQGINEGYTQLLTEKLFPEYISTTSISYPLETHYARLIEELVGEQNMIDLFFKADLRGLIIEIAKYSSVKDAVIFTRKLDVLNKYKYKDFLLVDVKLELQEHLYELNEFLVVAYENKLKQARGLTSKEKDIKMEEFIQMIKSGYIYSREKFKAFEEHSVNRN